MVLSFFCAGLCNFFADYAIGCSNRSIVRNRTSAQYNYQKPWLESWISKVFIAQMWLLTSEHWLLFASLSLIQNPKIMIIIIIIVIIITIIILN